MKILSKLLIVALLALQSGNIMSFGHWQQFADKYKAIEYDLAHNKPISATDKEELFKYVDQIAEELKANPDNTNNSVLSKADYHKLATRGFFRKNESLRDAFARWNKEVTTQIEKPAVVKPSAISCLVPTKKQLAGLAALAAVGSVIAGYRNKEALRPILEAGQEQLLRAGRGVQWQYYRGLAAGSRLAEQAPGWLGSTTSQIGAGAAALRSWLSCLGTTGTAASGETAPEIESSYDISSIFVNPKPVTYPVYETPAGKIVETAVPATTAPVAAITSAPVESIAETAPVETTEPLLSIEQLRKMY